MLARQKLTQTLNGPHQLPGRHCNMFGHMVVRVVHQRRLPSQGEHEYRLCRSDAANFVRNIFTQERVG